MVRGEGLADPREFAVPVIAVLVAMFALHWARTFCVSLLMGILIAYALNPVVVRLHRLRVPRWAGSTLVMVALSAALVSAAGAFGDQISAVLEQVPEAARRVSATLTARSPGERGTLEKVQAAAREIEKATSQVAGEATARRAQAVVVEQPAFKLSSFLWTNSLAVAAFAGQALMVLFLAFFLLLSADAFKRKFLRIAGPSLDKRKITLQVMEQINVQIQNFMFMLLTTNTLLAALSWAVFSAMGLENAGAWGLAAGLLHFIPYAGPAATAVAVGLAGFLQFGAYGMALAVAGASLAIATVVGMLIATFMSGKLARMNSAAVFVALLFWGWLWGVWGLLLAIPIVVAVKVVAESIEQLRPVAELLRA
jgi:predicted PurR-regulated permease PerM